MKIFKLLISIFILSLFSCTKSSLSPSTTEWQVGEASQEITKSFEITDQKQCTITLTSLSFCSNSGVEIEITENGKSIYAKSVMQFPFKDTIVIKSNTQITITTKAFINLLSSFACVRQGNVNCKVAF